MARHAADDKIRLGMSLKNSRLNFRISAELKERVESIAALEGRSVAQICEAFLKGGFLAYEKEGSKYISRFLGVRNTPARSRPS